MEKDIYNRNRVFFEREKILPNGQMFSRERYEVTSEDLNEAIEIIDEMREWEDKPFEKKEIKKTYIG